MKTLALMSAVVLAGNSAVRRDAPRTATVRAPTPEQLARRERADWNKAVDAKKAAKRAGKVEQVGADTSKESK